MLSRTLYSRALFMAGQNIISAGWRGKVGCEMRPGVRYRDRVLIDKMQGHVVTL